MEVQSKQKRKKRRTRKNLDEIRKRSRSEAKNNAQPKNSLKLHISKYSDIEQITSKRLTLALFNKTVKSETVTRLPLSKISNNYNAHNGKQNIDIYLTSFKQSHSNSNNASPTAVHEKSFAIKGTKPQIQNSSKIYANKSPDSDTLFSPFLKIDAHSVSDISLEGYKQEFMAHTTWSSSDAESQDCLYEKLMNNLPKYLSEHFPVLTKESSMNNNIAYLKQTYLNHCHQATQNNTLKCINNYSTMEILKDYRNPTIHKPMDYIQKGSSRQQNVKKKYLLISSDSSSSSQFGSNSNNSHTFVKDSPEYLYFPHKLNQS